MPTEKYDSKKLLRWINSIGKTNFIKCFAVFQSNFNRLNRHELGKLLSAANPEAKNSAVSWVRIASYAMGIFKNGQEWEALKICADSDRIDETMRRQALLLLSDHSGGFDKQVSLSLSDSGNIRKNRLNAASVIPEKIQITSSGYRRNPDVVAEILTRAGGKCECCGQSAPFIRKFGERIGEPFLEVHHKIWLSEGGTDSVDNAIALCPNCHRREHFGDRKYIG